MLSSYSWVQIDETENNSGQTGIIPGMAPPAAASAVDLGD